MVQSDEVLGQVRGCCSDDRGLRSAKWSGGVRLGEGEGEVVWKWEEGDGRGV